MQGTPVSLSGLPPLREVIAKHGLSAQKSLGQIFLLDLYLTGALPARRGRVRAMMLSRLVPDRVVLPAHSLRMGRAA